MESGKGKFDYEEKRGNDTSSEEEQILFKSKERKDTSSEEELGKKGICVLDNGTSAKKEE